MNDNLNTLCANDNGKNNAHIVYDLVDGCTFKYIFRLPFYTSSTYYMFYLYPGVLCIAIFFCFCSMLYHCNTIKDKRVF